METIRRSCPECRATLELPQSAVGRMARCPACHATFRVGGDAPADVTPTAPSKDPAGNEEDPAGNDPFSAPLQWPSEDPQNPYAVNPAVAAAAVEPVPKAEIVIRTASIDEIVSAATAIFSHRWQPLVIAGLILFGFSFAIGLGAGIVSALGQAMDPLATAAIAFVSQCLIGFVSYYLTIGVMTVALAVARGRDVTATEVFVSPAVFGRVLLPVTFLVLLGAVSQLVAVLLAGEAESLEGVLASVAVSMVTALITALLLLLIWPLFYVACDGRASNLSAVALGFRIAVRNIITSLFLVVIALVLGIAALATCGFGTILTQPILLLLGAVGYLQMTSQPIYNPNQQPVASPAYPYRQP